MSEVRASQSERGHGWIGRTARRRHAMETIGARIVASDTGIQHGPLWRECGEPSDDGSGKVCRRICAPGRDYHGGGHWYADPALDGERVRLSTARWIVTGEQPGEALRP